MCAGEHQWLVVVLKRLVHKCCRGDFSRRGHSRILTVCTYFKTVKKKHLVTNGVNACNYCAIKARYYISVCVASFHICYVSYCYPSYTYHMILSNDMPLFLFVCKRAPLARHFILCQWRVAAGVATVLRNMVKYVTWHDVSIHAPPPPLSSRDDKQRWEVSTFNAKINNALDHGCNRQPNKIRLAILGRKSAATKL